MPKIVFIGDSITKGTSYGGVLPTQTFAYKIGVANGYSPENVINAGVNSNTSADVLARLQTDVIACQPDVCVIMIGINDWWTNVTLGAYQSNMASILTTLKQAWIKPVVISSNVQRGPTADFYSFQKYRNAAIALCSQLGVCHIDLYTEVCTASLYYDSATFVALYASGDVVHLSVTGHQFVTDFCARQQFTGYFIKDQAKSDEEIMLEMITDHAISCGTSPTIQELQAQRAKI